MPLFQVELANCPLSGRTVTHLPNGEWRRDRVDLSIAGMSIVLRQTKEGLRHDGSTKGHTVNTTTLDFGDIPARRERLAVAVAGDIGWLLSLATMSPVRPFQFRFGNREQGISVDAKLSSWRPTVDTRDGEVVQRFVEATWKRFSTLRRVRRLPAVIDYLVIAEHRDQPIEVKTLLAFTALESLKSTHSPGKQGNFAARVSLMLRAVGMRRGLRRLVALRNRLIHEGLAGIAHDRLFRHYEQLQDIHREYLLRILGYRGSYLLYSSGSNQSRQLR